MKQHGCNFKAVLQLCFMYVCISVLKQYSTETQYIALFEYSNKNAINIINNTKQHNISQFILHILLQVEWCKNNYNCIHYIKNIHCSLLSTLLK